MKTLKGFSLVEMMIAITLAGVIATSVISLFFSQHRAIGDDEKRTLNIALSEKAYSDLNSLLRHAIASSISIDYDTGTLNQGQFELDTDSVTIDFSIPWHFPIWPNDKSPYDKNWVRIKWSNYADNDDRYALLIGSATDKQALSTAILSPLDSGKNSSVIANIDLWPLSAAGEPLANPQATPQGGYLLQIHTRSVSEDKSYQNPLMNADNPLLHYRTYTLSGIVSPRN